MSPVILVDGNPHASIAPLDRGIAYGDGIFRTMRAAGGRIAYWPRHYAKISYDCARLALPCPSEATLQDDVRRVLASRSDCVVKIIVTRGEGGRGYMPPIAPRPVRIVASFPLPEIASDYDALGIPVRWCRTLVSMQPALAGVKHLNRLDSVLARSEWAASGDFAEGLMLDRDGHVIQGTMSNVFIVEGDRLITPVLDTAGVAGVQRERVMSLAAECREEAITPERLLAADQVCLTNSVIGMWWIAQLGSRTWTRRDITAALIASIRRPDDD